MSYYKLGENFKWFVARVSDLGDPEYLGRVRIRVLHDQTGELGRIKDAKGGIANEDLLWAWPLSGIQSASLNWHKLTEKNVGLEEFQTPDWIDAVGISPTGIAIGTYVFGFYLDAFEQNIPIIFGTYHKQSIVPEPSTGDPEVHSMLQLEEPENSEYYSDVSALARGKEGGGGQTLPKNNPVFGTRYEKAAELDETNEPESAYKTKYPYNVTYTTKSGHAIELDDTPGHERLHIWHRSGSYEEISNGPSEDGKKFRGRRVKKTVGDDYEIVVKDKNVLVKQDYNQEIANTRNTFIFNDDVTQVVNNSVTDIGGTLRMDVGNGANINVRGGMKINARGSSITVLNGALNVDGFITSKKGYSGQINFRDQIITISGGLIVSVDKT